MSYRIDIYNHPLLYISPKNHSCLSKNNTPFIPYVLHTSQTSHRSRITGEIQKNKSEALKLYTNCRTTIPPTQTNPSSIYSIQTTSHTPSIAKYAFSQEV